MDKFLKIERTGSVVVLAMNQPETRNCLTGNTAIPELIAACHEINADKSVSVVILTGEGGAFSSGGNVKEMQRYQRDGLQALPISEEYRAGIQRLAAAIYHLETPVIAAVNGAAFGAGCDLACLCDIRVASETAKFAESFAKLGLISGDGGAWILPRVVGMSKAAEMSFTGEAIDAHEALRCGLVSQVVKPEELMNAAKALADKIASNPGQALRLTKRLLRESQHVRLDTMLELSAAFQAMAHKTPNHEEAVAAFVDKRAPRFS